MFKVTGCLQWLARESSDLETNIISVERIREYSEKPTEVIVISKMMNVANWKVKNKLNTLSFISCRYLCILRDGRYTI